MSEGGGPVVGVLGNFVVIGIPAICGLVGWAVLRQRNTQPLLAGCAAFTVALLVMTAIFLGMYTLG